MDKSHEILIRARDGLEIRCACGTFLYDQEGEAEISLPEITAAVGRHYLIVSHPEKFNGHKKPKLIEGKA